MPEYVFGNLWEGDNTLVWKGSRGVLRAMSTVQTKCHSKRKIPRTGHINLARPHLLRSKHWLMVITAIYLSSDENRYSTLPFGIRHLDLQVARKEAHGDVDSSWATGQEMDRTLSFFFSFVAVYLRALNPEAKRSAFGSCREEMKGSDGTAILWSSFLFKLCMIHGLH